MSYCESVGFPEMAMLEALRSPVRWENVPVDECNPEAGTYTVVVPPYEIVSVEVAEVMR